MLFVGPPPLMWWPSPSSESSNLTFDPTFNTNLPVILMSEASSNTKYVNSLPFSPNFLQMSSCVDRKGGAADCLSLIYKTPLKLRGSLLPSNTGEWVAGVPCSPPVSLFVNFFMKYEWKGVVFLFSTGCGEKMNAIQGISLALLSVLAANAQVIKPGRCPKPAVQEKFDAARVNTKPFFHLHTFPI